MRTLARFTPVRNLATDLFSDAWGDLDHVFENFAKWPNRNYDERAFLPACEVNETDEHFLISVDIPGLKKEEIKVEAEDNILTISGERNRQTSDKLEGRVQRSEKTYGFFKRSFTLPSTVDTENIEAHYENGVLELALPKVERAKSRHVEIKAGKSGLFDKLVGGNNPTTTKKDD